MRISYNWLKEFIDITDPAEKVSEILSSLGLEVEGMETVDSIQGGLKGIVVGEVVECVKHPNADKLSLTKVNIGSESLLQIVCGAPNVAQGQKVLVATEGAKLYPTVGEPFVIKKGKIRGEESQGMICADDELGLGHDHSGIRILDPLTPIGISGAKALQLESDLVFEIGLTPNRADATNHIGVAKDLAAWYRVHENKQLEFHYGSSKSLNSSDNVQVNIEIKNSVKSPRYTGVCFTNINIGPSPDWLQKKLIAMDQKPINNVVDITNLIMYEMGQPLHAFDLDKVNGKGFVVQTLAEGTPFTTLDHVERKLRAEDLMICDTNGAPLCIAGVLGGLDSGVSETTKTIFLESAHFQASTVRKSSTKHNIRSQAARSFEKGSDPNSCIKALERAAALLEEICGATQASKLYDFYPQSIDPCQIEVQVEDVKKLSGLNINRETLKEVLLALDMKVIDHQDDRFTVFVPTNKPDVTRFADVVEEISRVYGLDHIPLPEKFNFAMPKSVSSIYSLRKKISQSLVAKGCNEIVSLSLSSSKQCIQSNLWKEENLIYIHNTSNSHLDIMKPSILLGGLEAIQYNTNRQNTDLKLFEIGKEFTRNNEMISESTKMGIWLTGLTQANHWTNTKDQSSDFHTIKSYVESIFSELKFEKLKVIEIENQNIYSYGLSWTQGQKIIAQCGAVHPSVLKAFDLKKAVWFAEFDLEIINARINSKLKKFEEFTKFPVIRRDLAVVIPKSVSFDSLKQIASKSCGKNLVDVNVFDVFEDEKKLGEGKKSYALNFTFESLEKSLNSEEIDKIMNKLIENYESQIEAIIRR